MNDFVWVFVRPDNPYKFAMIPPAPTRNTCDWWRLLVILTKFL